MEITYSAGTVRTTPYKDPNMLRVHADVDVLNDIIHSLELHGVSEGQDYNDIAIYNDAGDTHLILDRATFALWFQFEVLNYLHVSVGDYDA